MRFVHSIIVLALIAACKTKDKLASPVSPQDAVSTFVVPDDFQIELIAAEPLVADPVAMEVDEFGNIYVVEMHGYPLDLKGSGVIKLLTDSDGDGLPDKSEVFADSLVLPNGILRWKQGVLVTDPPHLYYLEDSNGDGKADIRKIVITGFALSNPQHNANSPILGVDNWIYIAHEGSITPNIYKEEYGDKGSEIHFPENPGAPTLPRGANDRSIRLKPDTYELEMLSGESQFGHTFDNWGHHFNTSNADHIFSEVIAARYLQRNPLLLVATTTHDLSDHGNASKVFPITENAEHQLLTDVGVFTSACGITWYNGGLFGDNFKHTTFVAEPVHNLVHADKITSDGSTFVASRQYDNREFLASTDAWSRPVNFYVGPDGALYMIDYYRQIIEHPEWMSEEVAKSGELYNGSDKGRIYRITPKGTTAMNWCSKLNLSMLSDDSLIQYLAHDNAWWRRNAQRMLLDRNNEGLPDQIKNFLSNTSSPEGVVHGLWMLDELGKMNPDIVVKAFRHETAGVRENAIRIAESYLDSAVIRDRLLLMANDPDEHVRFQLLCTLGFLRSPESRAAREKILEQSLDDHWMQVAALSTSDGSPLQRLHDAVNKFSSAESDGSRSFIESCATLVILSENKNEIENALRISTDGKVKSWVSASILRGLSEGLKEGEIDVEFNNAQSDLFKIFEPGDEALQSAVIDFLSSTASASGPLKPQYHSLALRMIKEREKELVARNAVRLLSLTKDRADTTLLQSLIVPGQPSSTQLEAVRAYQQIDEMGAAEYLIGSWNNLGRLIRDEAIRNFLKHENTTRKLLTALEKGQIHGATIQWPKKVYLMNHDNEDIRGHARKLLAGRIGDRQQALSAYQRSLSLTGSVEKGKMIFSENCSICHQVGGIDGIPYGPDLGTIRNRDKKFILMDILDPNRSIADGFEFWEVKKKNDEIISGIISSETSESITVVTPDSSKKLIARKDIASMVTTDRSAMPEGLENNISEEQMADLISFLKKTASQK